MTRYLGPRRAPARGVPRSERYIDRGERMGIPERRERPCALRTRDRDLGLEQLASRLHSGLSPRAATVTKFVTVRPVPGAEPGPAPTNPPDARRRGTDFWSHAVARPFVRES